MEVLSQSQRALCKRLWHAHTGDAEHRVLRLLLRSCRKVAVTAPFAGYYENSVETAQRAAPNGFPFITCDDDRVMTAVSRREWLSRDRFVYVGLGSTIDYQSRLPNCSTLKTHRGWYCSLILERHPYLGSIVYKVVKDRYNIFRIINHSARVISSPSRVEFSVPRASLTYPEHQNDITAARPTWTCSFPRPCSEV